MHEIFKASQTALLSFPELDCWGPRDGISAMGAAYILDVGETAVWLETGRRKVFAYLSIEQPMLDQIRQDLSASAMEYLIYLRGADSAQLAQWQMPHIKAVNRPLKLGQALARCDAVLGYGGMGMASATLMAGKPSVYITRDLENHTTASLVEKLGAGLHLNRHAGASLATLLTTVIEQSSFTTVAQQFAIKHRKHDPSNLSTKILDQFFDVKKSKLAVQNQALLKNEASVT